MTYDDIASALWVARSRVGHPPGRPDERAWKRGVPYVERATGELMSSSYDIGSVPYNRRLEHHNALDALFAENDATELLRFLATCTR